MLFGRDKNVAFVDFVYTVKKKNVEFPNFYFIIFDTIGLNPYKIINKDAKEEGGSWTPFQIWKNQATEVIQGGKAAYSSVQNLQKASGLSKKKVTVFFYQKSSNTNFRQATRRFKRLPAFAKRIIEIWCPDFAFMNELSEFNSDVKFSLSFADVFSRLVRVQSVKSRYASDAVAAFKKWTLRKNTKPDRVWVDQGTAFGGEFK